MKNFPLSYPFVLGVMLLSSSAWAAGSPSGGGDLPPLQPTAEDEARSPEEKNGCSDSPDVKTAGEICVWYRKMEKYYGKTSSWFNREAETCYAYYKAAVRTRNIICAYKKEADAMTVKLNSLQSAASTGTQIGSMNGAAAIYAENKAMHEKYLGLLSANRMDLVIEQQNRSRSLMGSEQYHRVTFTDEAWCRGGATSKIPSFYLAGIYAVMRAHLGKVHPQVDKASFDARNLAQSGARAAGQAEVATRTAATNLGNVGAIPVPGSPPADAEHGHFHAHDLALETGIRAAQEKITQRTVEHKATHYAGQKLGSATAGRAVGGIAGVLAGIAFYTWKDGFDVGVVISASVSIFGVGPGIAATVVEVLIRNDMARKKYYQSWGMHHLHEHQQIDAATLSKDYCNHIEQMAAEEKRRRDTETLQRMQNNADCLRITQEWHQQMAQRRQQFFAMPAGPEKDAFLQQMQSTPPPQCGQ